MRGIIDCGPFGFSSVCDAGVAQRTVIILATNLCPYDGDIYVQEAPVIGYWGKGARDWNILQACTLWVLLQARRLYGADSSRNLSVVDVLQGRTTQRCFI